MARLTRCCSPAKVLLQNAPTLAVGRLTITIPARVATSGPSHPIRPEQDIPNPGDGIDAIQPRQQKIDSRVKQYAKLSKIRLTGFVTSTVITGGYIASQSFLGSLPIIATAAFGTFLCSSSAAALNQFLETPYDSQMRRTAIRPLVVGQVSSLETVIFALVTGLSGITILSVFVNSLTAALGAANLVLYSFVYTPMKRSNVANTWIGSIVGAVPPIMGSTAVLGHISIDSALLALILFSWQFPHFNALSWNLRHEYARAGYRMMSVVDPDLCKRVALRHSGLLLLYTCALPFYGQTSSLFTLLALPFNFQFIRLSWLFYKQADSSSSRKLFRFSLVYLPAILALLLITQPSLSKFDLLQGNNKTGEGDDDESFHGESEE